MSFRLIFRQSVMVFLFGLLTACVYPEYKFSGNEQTAKLRYVTVNSVSMCKDGKYYSLKKVLMRTDLNKKEYVLVPSGKRITLEKRFKVRKSASANSCYPAISFIPKANMVYLVNAGVIDSFCYIEVVREDTRSPVGVSSEPTSSKLSYTLNNSSRTCLIYRGQ